MGRRGGYSSSLFEECSASGETEVTVCNCVLFLFVVVVATTTAATTTGQEQ
jgi:hypothetical protein